MMKFRVLIALFLVCLCGDLCRAQIAPDNWLKVTPNPAVFDHDELCYFSKGIFNCPQIPLTPCGEPVQVFIPREGFRLRCTGTQVQTTNQSGPEIDAEFGESGFKPDGTVWLVPCQAYAQCIPGELDQEGNATSCVADLANVRGGALFASGALNHELWCTNPEP